MDEQTVTTVLRFPFPQDEFSTTMDLQENTGRIYASAGTDP